MNKVRVQRTLHHLGWILEALNVALKFRWNAPDAKRAAADGPVLIPDCCRPAFALLKIDY
jgi:hypothetical protein